MASIGGGGEALPPVPMEMQPCDNYSLAKLTMFVAITFPFFSALLSFFGGFAFAPTTYFLPYIMWLTIHKPKTFSISWFTNWICIVLGVLLMILSPIGGLREIILRARTYHFYR